MFKNLSIADSYNLYSANLIENNPNLITSHQDKCKHGLILDEDKNFYINYKLYKKILSIYYSKAGDKMLEGYNFSLGVDNGSLFIMRQGRSPNAKPRINKGESFKYKKELEKEGKEITKDNWKIYYTDDEYTRTNWYKGFGTKNINFYKFVPAGGQPNKGFRQKMSKTITENPNLLILYPYIDSKHK